MKKNKIKLFDQLTPVILKSNGASKESGESKINFDQASN